MSETLHPCPMPAADVKRKQLRFRAWHRGIKEMDLIFGHFADTHLDGLDSGELALFEALLGLPDQLLYHWLSGREPIPPHYDTDLWQRIMRLDYLPRASAAGLSRTP